MSDYLGTIVLILLVLGLLGTVWLLRPVIRGLRWILRVSRVFFVKGEAPMDSDHYAVYREVKHMGAFLTESGGASRLILVETAPGVQRMVIDVSSRGQFTTILEHMRKRPPLPKSEQVVVDIGANDGFQGSHSYNFVGLGWWAALVEANPLLEPELRKNALEGRWLGHGERVVVRMVAATRSEDGPRTLHLRGWRHSATSLLKGLGSKGHQVEVRAEGVKTLGAAIHQSLIDRGLSSGLPSGFGVLSLDVEGVDFEVLCGFLDLGYRPRYVVVEERVDLGRYDRLLGPHGYERLAAFDADAIYFLETNP